MRQQAHHLSSSPSSHSTPSTSPAPLARYGWDAAFAEAFAPYAADGLLPGRIVRVDRGLCDAVVPAPSGPGTDSAGAEAGLRTVRADLAPVSDPDPTRWACTGDWIAYDGDEHAVRALLPRRTAVLRSASSKRSDGQVLAANVDHVLIAVSLAAELDLGRAERFLALAWESGAQPLVVLTKADLVPDPATLAHLVADVEATAPGVSVLTVSAATGDGLDVLTAAVAGGTTVLLGQSGAGKSTLANSLLGSGTQTVRTIRDSDGKGRHTTTTRDLLPLPLPGGGVLIDTPGLRGVGLWDAEDGVARVFAEIEELAGDCRFHDCAHTAEPGCAVLAALEDGTLQERRLDSYRKLIRENEWIASRTDARLRAERRRVWKQRQALGKHLVQRKRGPQR
ncbi:ribosome small subunit-dependent GTPase A [Streptomyces xinghaiensis]|uniref:ribosome small subunit-dependent GTPase A n=1 Tax=Streptomyces xinghaiensis TaxID=1038928 RepID=UPI0002D45DAC|nr:ribosome small subunit-dependent GTPase A [Streptomyces xinghaiensis]MZE81700.1 ribosome small subunit-dependent GTPase A [Streptomyces sp. SID5475]